MTLVWNKINLKNTSIDYGVKYMLVKTFKMISNQLSIIPTHFRKLYRVFYWFIVINSIFNTYKESRRP